MQAVLENQKGGKVPQAMVRKEVGRGLGGFTGEASMSTNGMIISPLEALQLKTLEPVTSDSINNCLHFSSKKKSDIS